MIRLSCHIADSLNWDLENIPKTNNILWYLDTGLELESFPFDEEMRFNALILAMQTFSDKVWPIFHETTQGIVLYKGSCDFSKNFAWTSRQKLCFEEWKLQQPNYSEKHLQRLYCADVFVNYFQLLAHRLPDQAPIYLFFDAADVGSIAEKHHLLSKERFEHFEIATKSLPFTNGLIWNEQDSFSLAKQHSLGVCLPENSFCSPEVLQKIDQKILEIKKPFRMISERFLTEEWNELDTLYILKSALSPRGERKLTGFTVTGGTILSI